MQDLPEVTGIENRTPIDGVLAALIHERAENQDGFALSVARKLTDGKEAVTFSVQSPVPVHDEWEAPVAYRAHAVEDVESLSKLAKKYSDGTKGLVLYTDEGATLILDEMIAKGQRELIRLTFAYSPEWIAWSKVLGAKLDHRDLLTHAILQQHTLTDASLLASLRCVKATFNAKLDSDLRETREEVGIVFTAAAGDELVKFPKAIEISLPVLDIDVAELCTAAKTARVRLEFKLPTEPKMPVTFQLLCPEWNALRRTRINAEITKLKAFLGDGWTVVRGSHKQLARDLPR